MPGVLNTVDPSSYGPIFNITAEKGNVVLNAAAKAGRRVTRVYGFNSSSASDHRFQQCIDFMHYGNMAMRDWLVQYLIKNAGPLGVMGIISNRRCMGFPANEQNRADCEVSWRGPAGVWRPYGGGDPHTDHVHVQFNTNKVGGGLSAGTGGTSGGSSGGEHLAKPDKGGWEGTLIVAKGPVAAFDGNGNRRKDLDLKKGDKVTGEVDSDPFNGDGRYFRKGDKPHSIWYPLDDENFVHTEGGKPIGAEPKVSIDKVTKAAQRDPARAQGGTTHTAEDDVRVVEAALRSEGLLDREYSKDGSFGSSSIEAYKKWQKKLGYSGKDADGIPGGASLKKLGVKYDFKVVA